MIEFPNEVILEILAHFTLKSLIVARGVNHQWRRFVDIADVLPIRRTLLDLYLRVIDAPWFLRSRPWVLENLRPFDREAYVHALSQYRCRIPDDFALWILEWPACASFRALWPGFPDTEVKARFNPIKRAAGINCIGALPPTVYAITYRETTVDAQTGKRHRLDTDIPGLAIREERHGAKTWLLLDESDMFHGAVLCTEIHEMFARDTNPLTAGYSLESSWLEFLEKERQEVDEIWAMMSADYITPPPSPPTHWREPDLPDEWPKITEF